MLSAIWSVLAIPSDDTKSAYLVSNFPSRYLAYLRRSTMAYADRSTTFVVFMQLVVGDGARAPTQSDYEPELVQGKEVPS